jgi:hypothetical protein
MAGPITWRSRSCWSLDRLADCLPPARAVSVVATSRKNWIVLASPEQPSHAFDPARCRISETNKGGTPTIHAVENRADQDGQERCSNHSVEVEEPVGEPRNDQQRHQQAEHPAQAVQRQEPPDGGAKCSDP